MSPSALITIMHNAPKTEELLKIEGVVRIERLTNTRIRLHFKGDDSIVGRVVNRQLPINGICGKSQWKKNLWIKCLLNYPERKCELC